MRVFIHTSTGNEPYRVPNSVPKTNFLAQILVPLALIGGILGVYGCSAILPARPSRLAHVRAALTGATFRDGEWYWLEGAGTPESRIVEASRSGAKNLAAEPKIRSFFLADGNMAWVSGEGRAWVISVLSLKGGQKRILTTESNEVSGLCIADHRVLWLEHIPPPFSGGEPLPPLEQTLRVVSAPLDGGQATVVGTIMEPRGEQILGVHGGNVYVAASRPPPQRVFTIYRIPLAGGAAKRLVGETGEHAALLTANGTLYWTAPSPEAAQVEKVFCVRRLTGDGPIETLDDWLSGGGRLYEAGGATVYVDGSTYGAVWPIGGNKRLPESLTMPAGYNAIAAGDGEVLLQPAQADSAFDAFTGPLR